jgi:hypothetical protein
MSRGVAHIELGRRRSWAGGRPVAGFNKLTTEDP